MKLVYQLLSFLAVVAATTPTCIDAVGEAKGHDLTGKVFVLTGADTGIGLETSKAILSTNASLIMGVYSVDHGLEVAKELAVSSGNDKVEVVQLDLSSFRSVRAFAANVLNSHSALHSLINDAGISNTTKPPTEDGFDQVFQVNYLGAFLLTDLLLPALRNAAPFSTVINVASAASFSACIWGGYEDNCLDRNTFAADIDHMARTAPTGEVYPGVPASNYGLTKFLQVHHAKELARRELALGSVVRAYSLHPGFVDTPMTKVLPAAVAKQWCAPLPFSPGVCPITAAAGAATQTFIAVSSFAAAPQHDTGSFFTMCAAAPPPQWTGAAARDMFDLATKWTQQA